MQRIPTMILAATCFLTALPAFAGSADRGHGEEWQAQRRALLEERRDIESMSHQARIQILSEADRCIHAATTPRAYRACEKREREARQALRARVKSRLQALKEKARLVRPLKQRRDLAVMPRQQG